MRRNEASMRRNEASMRWLQSAFFRWDSLCNKIPSDYLTAQSTSRPFPPSLFWLAEPCPTPTPIVHNLSTFIERMSHLGYYMELWKLVRDLQFEECLQNSEEKRCQRKSQFCKISKKKKTQNHLQLRMFFGNKSIYRAADSVFLQMCYRQG